MGIELDSVKVFLVNRLETSIPDLSGRVFPYLNQDKDQVLPSVGILSIGATPRIRLPRNDNDIFEETDPITGLITVYQEIRGSTLSIGIQLKTGTIADRITYGRLIEAYLARNIEEKIFVLEDKSLMRFLTLDELLDFEEFDDPQIRIYKRQFNYSVETSLVLPDPTEYYPVEIIRLGIETTFTDLQVASGSDFSPPEYWYIS